MFALALGAALLAIPIANASEPLVASGYSLQTIAYDGFDYPVGGLDGQSGGDGWTNSWFRSYGSGGYAQVQATGLTYPDLDVVGGSVVWGFGGNEINGFSRSIPVSNSGITYVQFLTHLGSQSGGGTPTFRLFDESSGVTVQSGAFGNNGPADMAILDAGLTSLAGSGASMNQLLLTIVRINYDDLTTSMWTNPDLSTFNYASPPVADAVATGFAPSFSRIDPYVRSGAVYDELRVMRLVPPPPPPPAPRPASSPQGVVATPGDSSVRVTWQTPSTSGSFPISHYQVSGSPGGTCLVAAHDSALACDITGLRNGIDYTFRVRALTGAGWSPWSDTAVARPTMTPAILINGSRSGSTVQAVGIAKGLAGEEVTIWVRYPGPHPYLPVEQKQTRGSAERMVWTRQTNKKVYVIFTSSDGVRSNRLVIPPRAWSTAE